MSGMLKHMCIIAEDTSNTNAESEVDEQTGERTKTSTLLRRGFPWPWRRMKELNAEGSIHVDLREYYLSFADALLTKEEEKNDLFEFLKKMPETEEDSTEKEEVTDEQVIKIASFAWENFSRCSSFFMSTFYSHLYPFFPLLYSRNQLAFEMFEFARKCYELLVEQKKEMSKKDILNYTYVFIRLGDISLLNHFFEEALKEYQKCVELREKHKVGDENLIAPLISLSQSYMFCGKRKEAVDYFEKVKKILLDVRQKTTPLPDNTNEKIIRDTYDDVQIQINDLKRQIEEEGEEGTELGSQTIAKELSEFDKAVLNKENSEVTKITISTVNGDEQGTKRRRINLSNYKN
eukprot:XP_002260559.1 hypothetical protein, conserved in Plasmodium species [Plasmodium knowlesi strain H]